MNFHTIKYSIVQYFTVEYMKLQCIIVQYCTVKCSTLHYCIVGYSAIVLYNAVRCSREDTSVYHIPYSIVHCSIV